MISIVMAVYNGADYLEETVASIQAQSYTDWELIIVDDASEDATLQIAKSLASRDARIHILQNETNLKLAASLNYAVKYTDHEFIARQDCGDISHPDRLQKQIEFLALSPATVLLGTRFHTISPDGDHIFSTELPIRDGEIREEIKQRNPFAHGSVVFRKSIFDHVGGYDETFVAAQDYELWMRLLKHGEAYNLPDYLYSWRLQIDSTSIRNFDVQYAYMQCAQKQMNYDVQDLRMLMRKAPILQNYIVWIKTLVLANHDDIAEELSQQMSSEHIERMHKSNYMLSFVLKQAIEIFEQHSDMKLVESFICITIRDNKLARSKIFLRMYSSNNNITIDWSHLDKRLTFDIRNWKHIIQVMIQFLRKLL